MKRLFPAALAVILGGVVAGCEQPEGDDTTCTDVCDCDDTDTTVPEGCEEEPADGDEDGSPGCTPELTVDCDCDDADPTVYSGAGEVCDGKDQDCDGNVDEGVQDDFYVDGDGDGYGAGDAIAACGAASGHSAQAGDCDDAAPDVHPGVEETCNDLDDDCDGTVDELDCFCEPELPDQEDCDALSGALPTPIAYWSMDADDVDLPTISDFGDGTYDLTAQNVSSALDGAVSGGLVFDGTSSVATADLPKNQALTASLWLRPASFPTDRSHVALNQGNGPQTWTGWGFSVLTDGRIRSFVEGGTGSTELAAGTLEPVCLDRWTHVAVTIGGGELRLYRDGVYQESVYPTLPIAYSTNGFVLGFHSYYKGYYYDGDMDELAVWDLVLTDAEIAEIALRGLCGAPVVE